MDPFVVGRLRLCQGKTLFFLRGRRWLEPLIASREHIGRNIEPFTLNAVRLQVPMHCAFITRAVQGFEAVNQL